MVDPLPPEVGEFLGAAHPLERDAAWGRFVATHSRLLLHVARSVTRDPDSALDAYAWILEHLRQDDGRRLATFEARGDSKFTTWLVVVARRMCLDFLRHQRGRSRRDRAGSSEAQDGRKVRRRLLELAWELELTDALPDPSADPSVDAENHERLQLVREVLAEVPPEGRLLLSLRFEDELSAAEIARVMDLPSPFHVYRRLDRLLTDLRGRMNGRGIDGADG